MNMLKSIKYKIEKFIQRLVRGWDDSELFNLELNFYKSCKSRLERILETAIGYPDRVYVLDRDGDYIFIPGLGYRLLSSKDIENGVYYISLEDSIKVNNVLPSYILISNYHRYKLNVYTELEWKKELRIRIKQLDQLIKLNQSLGEYELPKAYSRLKFNKVDTIVKNGIKLYATELEVSDEDLFEIRNYEYKINKDRIDLYYNFMEWFTNYLPALMD